MYDVDTLIAIARLRLEGLTYREVNSILDLPDGRTCKAMNSPLGKLISKYCV